MHLVEALVYGLAGGKPGARTERSQYSNLGSEFPAPGQGLEFPRPPAAVGIRGSALPLPSPTEVAQGLPQGMAMSGRPDPELARFQPVFDPAEMMKLNQSAIADIGRRKLAKE